MKLGVISDIHGSIDSWKKIMNEYFQDVEAIIHAGDLFDDFKTRVHMKELADEINALKIPFIAAKGNCDSEEDMAAVNFPVASPYAFAQMESIRILVHHAKKLSDKEKVSLAKRWKIDVFIFGHTHIPEVREENRVVLFNPGSPSMGKREQSVGIIEIDGGKKLSIKVYDINKGSVLSEINESGM